MKTEEIVGEEEPENGEPLTGTDLPVDGTSPASIQRIQISLHYQLQEKQKFKRKLNKAALYIQLHRMVDTLQVILSHSLAQEINISRLKKKLIFTLTHTLPPLLPFSYLV